MNTASGDPEFVSLLKFCLGRLDVMLLDCYCSRSRGGRSGDQPVTFVVLHYLEGTVRQYKGCTISSTPYMVQNVAESWEVQLGFAKYTLKITAAKTEDWFTYSQMYWENTWDNRDDDALKMHAIVIVK